MSASEKYYGNQQSREKTALLDNTQIINHRLQIVSPLQVKLDMHF